MQEHWTFILLGACVIVLLGLFYYYMNRQIQGVQNAHNALTNHILYQQKVLEKHDQLFSQTLGVPRSFPTESQRPSAPTPATIPASANPISLSVPTGVSLDTTPTTTTTAPTESNNSAAAAFSSVASLGPMVGTILNMFQNMQPMEDDEEENNDDAIPVGPTLSREDLQKELSKELEELQHPSPPPVSPTRLPRTEAAEPKKREGRVESVTELAKDAAVTAEE